MDVSPCNIIISISFCRFFRQSITEGKTETKSELENPEDVLDISTLSWAEYFGFYAPTVTVTQTELQTVTAKDPRIVVSFAVKGCKPLRIPNDLDR